jgi:hypothetical protein
VDIWYPRQIRTIFIILNKIVYEVYKFKSRFLLLLIIEIVQQI